MLAHGGGGGFVGLILVVGIVVIFLALVISERSGSTSKKD